MDKSRCVCKVPKGGRRKAGGSAFAKEDPVFEQSLLDQSDLAKGKKSPKKTESVDVRLRPTLSKRVRLIGAHCPDKPLPSGAKYVAPKSRKQIKLDRQRHEKYKQNLKFCSYDFLEIPKPEKSTKLEIKLQAPSAEIKEARIFPRKPSTTPSELYPEPPNRKDLTTREPKSGTIINVTKIMKRRIIKKKRRAKKPVKRPSQGPTIEEMIAQELATIQEMEGDEYEDRPPLTKEEENYLTKQFRRKVSQLSKSTSFKSADYNLEEEGEETLEKEDKFISSLVQKFRRDSEIRRYQRPRRKIKKGTFENFSYTTLRQPTLKTFYYGVKLGSVHQGDRHFAPVCRYKQGICIPIAAFCLSILKHPDRWTTADIDDVLEAGNELFLESVNTQHLHGDNVDIKVQNLRKYCKIGRKKVRFVVSQPEISGTVRSDDKKVYNLTKAMNIFFGKYKAGVLETDVLSVAIWKDKHYYFFDGGPRTIDLFTHKNGAALMANFYDTASVISVLLNRSDLDNKPFILYSIQAFKVLSRDAEEVDSTGAIPESDNFQVLDEEKAVCLGSFDLADKCFGFSRNKQALTIAVTSLVYSKITPPSSWHKGTIDKIVIIGNQLFLECIENDQTDEIKVEDLPAVFTIGPYVVEIYIVPNAVVDFLFKKSKCVLLDKLQTFFEKHSNAVIQIDHSTIAVWKQRNIYHCFDPYSRNKEGFKCRDGTACVSMHTNLNSLIATVSKNFDHKDMIFHIHAMKVCKIHRDPATKELFPKCLTMNEYPIENFKKIRMKKGKRKASAKPVTVDHDTSAVCHYQTLPDGSIMEVGSTVRSIGMEDLPPMVHRVTSRPLPPLVPPDAEFIADLDSPSLSDTQIEPDLPQQPDGETVIDFQDLDSFQLTQEEKEMHKRGEGEGEGGAGKKGGGEGVAEGGEGAGSDEWYMAATQFTQVGSRSLLERMSAEVNTEPFSVEIPDEEVPQLLRDVTTICKVRKEINVYEFHMMPEPDVTLSEELRKETNFLDLPDGSQIILGSTNIAAFGSELEVMAPFVCIMAAAVAKKYAISSWSKDVVDYVLKCGTELYTNSNTRYDLNYKLEIPRISLGKTDFSIKVNYIFDTYLKPRVLAMALCNMLFPQWPVGIVVTPTYSCTVFYKNHLFYLYDCFGNNVVGLSAGPGNEGVACLARFQDIMSLVTRILHNKSKREQEENVEYNRFVLSSCYVKLLPREIELKEEDEDLEAEGGDERDRIEVKTYKKSKEPAEEKPPKMGYKLVGKLYKIQGTKAIGDEKSISAVLKEDYFACLGACLMVLNTPLKKWDSRKVDAVVDQGMHIFQHSQDVEVCSKKFIKNVIIGDHIFDVIAHKHDFAQYTARRTLRTGIETMLKKKHENFILQFPNRSYALSVEGNTFHLFDPNDHGKASWTRYKNFTKLVRRLQSGLVKGGESYNFHVFEIMTIAKAPKQIIISNRAKKYKALKTKKMEMVGRPFYEEISWLDVEPVPWSWRVNKSDLAVWHNWYIDITDDLFSLFGSISPLDERFPPETRKKQTLGNLVVAIGMTQIYELADWSVNVMDSILISGDAFFKECIKDISDENYEVAFEDFRKECIIFPYSFLVEFTPVVEGTMFLVRLKQFNLYKALRLFFDDYEKRFGVVCVSKGENDRRLYAFGKLQEAEYFMYDCETLGPHMFVERNSGVPYILRTTTLNRLLHVMTLTIRGGDFYVFDVGLSEFKSLA